ncbi:oligopeptide ABC transporter ATP-binding [Vibrio ishigakensis]|uniref:Oligopeptide ABC transporter ATP-binding n=1 Tax=Vibrio ishigakensis TaxID=1481914 RepID=A0A0B8QE31_9VIBR|nr:oligopeptide ABC transporter ATP-binding [Vibrio ishigakensis]
MLEPKLIILDEPTAALDVSVQATIVNLLNKLKREKGLSYLFITHDLGLVERIADRVLVMYLGEIVESGPVADVFYDTQHPYTRALLDSIPSLDPNKRDSLQALNGEVPSAMDKPVGCAFQSRCQRVSNQCIHAHPELSAEGDNHASACFHPLTFNQPQIIRAVGGSD